MKISKGDLNEPALLSLGAEAQRILIAGRFDLLASRFDYAIAFGREPSVAIREDLSRILETIGAQALATQGSVSVRFFKPNTLGLLADVHCFVLADNGQNVVFALVVFESDQ